MEDQISGVLGGRPIFWCPAGGGPAYCPRPTDPDAYIYCCTFGYDISRPSCCRYSTFAGLYYAYSFGAIIGAALLLFFICWCCPWCPLAKQVQRVSEEKQLREKYITGVNQ